MIGEDVDVRIWRDRMLHKRRVTEDLERLRSIPPSPQ